MTSIFDETGSAMPDFNIPDSKKNLEWHKQFALYVIGSTVPGDAGWYATGYQQYWQLYQYYYGDANKIPAVNRTTNDGTPSVMPSNVAPNLMKLAIDMVIGEMFRVEAVPYAQATNRDSYRKKNEEKMRLLTKMRMEAIDREFEALSGEKLVPEDEYIPTSMHELNLHMDKFQTESEKQINSLIQWLIGKYPLKDTIEKCLQEVLITNVAALYYSVEGRNVTWKPLMGWQVLFDPSPTDDFLTTTSWRAVTDLQPLASVLSRYELTEDQIKEVYELAKKSNFASNSWQSFFSFGGTMLFNQNSNMTMRFNNNNALPNQINVTTVYFRDNEYTYIKKSKDKNDNWHNKEITYEEYIKLKKRQSNNPEKENQYKVEKTRRQIIRYCTLVGGCIVPENGWGVCENIPRKITNPDHADFPITIFCPDYKMGMMKSIADRMRPLQDLVNIIWYKIQEEIAQAPYLVVLNNAFFNSNGGASLTDSFNAAKASRLLIANPLSDKLASPEAWKMKPAEVLPLTIQSYLAQLMEMLERIMVLMLRQVGITETRMGQQSAEMGYRAQAMSLQNAQNSTFYIQAQMFGLMERAIDKFVNYIKLHLAPDDLGELLDLPLGDSFKEWGELAKDCATEDYAVFIRTITKEDIDMIMATIDLEVQAGTLSAAQAARFRIDAKHDPIGSLRRLTYFTEESKRLAKEQELASQEMQMEASMQAAGMGRETAAMQMQGNLQSTQIKEMAETERQNARLQQREMERMTNAQIEELRLQLEALTAERERIKERIDEKTD